MTKHATSVATAITTELHGDRCKMLRL